jgi:hypothetical protein
MQTISFTYILKMSKRKEFSKENFIRRKNRILLTSLAHTPKLAKKSVICEKRKTTRHHRKN